MAISYTETILSIPGRTHGNPGSFVSASVYYIYMHIHTDTDVIN